MSEILKIKKSHEFPLVVAADFGIPGIIEVKLLRGSSNLQIVFPRRTDRVIIFHVRYTHLSFHDELIVRELFIIFFFLSVLYLCWTPIS